MNKDKQIEEMAQIIALKAFEQAHLIDGDENLADIVATDLYEKGYRKQSAGCDFCKTGSEKCGTCVMFFDYHEDGGSDRCYTEYGADKCAYYKPVHFCSNCGAKINAERRSNDER